jgi:hypothetical protein
MIQLCGLCVLCGEKFKKGFYNFLYKNKPQNIPPKIGTWEKRLDRRRG